MFRRGRPAEPLFRAEVAHHGRLRLMCQFHVEFVEFVRFLQLLSASPTALAAFNGSHLSSETDWHRVLCLDKYFNFLVNFFWANV